MIKSWTSLLLIVIIMAGFLPLHILPASGYTFGSIQALGPQPGPDELPTTLTASDGTLWVVWQNSNNGPYTLLYKTFTGLAWSAVQTVPTGVPQNRAPSISQLLNGSIIIVFSSNQTGHWNLYDLAFNNGSWSKSAQVTSDSFAELSTGTTVSPDSTLWLVFERDFSNTLRQIYYKTLVGNVWSADSQLTSDPTLNVTPTVMTAKDRSIWVSWAKFSTVTSQFFIYLQIFNGTKWSSPFALTTAKTNANIFDVEPSIVQDRNGTIWAFWSREVTLSRGFFEQKLFYKFSGDAGMTWSAETQLTFGGDSTNPIDDLTPSAVQGSDKSLWIFYTSDPTTSFTNSFDIYFIKTNPISPVHDVAVTGIQPSLTKLYPYGDAPASIATIAVTVADLGDFDETVQLTVQVANKTTFTLGPVSGAITHGTSRTFLVNWNATNATPGRYTIVASVAPVPGETIGAAMDNRLSFKSVGVLYFGDLDKSGQVDFGDVTTFLFGYLTTPGATGWNPDADLDRDNVIDFGDVVAMLFNYQKTI
jgi:hypothetical protein